VGVDRPVCSIRVISNRVMSISWEVRLKDFHAIDQIGAACNEHRIVVRRCLLDGFFHRGSADAGKVFMPKLLLHALTSLLLARVALARYLLDNKSRCKHYNDKDYLNRSLISASEDSSVGKIGEIRCDGAGTATSSSKATEAQICPGVQ